jgi:hypothetical protein
MPSKIDRPRATEAQEQEALFDWAMCSMGKWPELGMLFHIANEGKRSPITGAAMVRQGMRRGVPDIFLPVPMDDYHGLFIELKAHGGRATKEQKQWIERLRGQGYAAEICYGWDKAREIIEIYLKGAYGWKI